jgi:hypothetical protein
MSYLNPTRVHFAGLFRADVSTVNNEDLHFNPATFTPNDQDYGNNTDNGWWHLRAPAHGGFAAARSPGQPGMANLLRPAREIR